MSGTSATSLSVGDGALTLFGTAVLAHDAQEAIAVEPLTMEEREALLDMAEALLNDSSMELFIHDTPEKCPAIKHVERGCIAARVLIERAMGGMPR